jgi:hypothetical protein
MPGKKIKYLFLILLVAVIAFILYDSVSQPNANDLKGNFKEVALYRNANNTGPIIRIYAVTVQGSPWEEMEKFGELMPYTKYGSTSVYFFQENKPAPKNLTPGTTNFDPMYNKHWLARYEKDANGQVSFVKNPLN